VRNAQEVDKRPEDVKMKKGSPWFINDNDTRTIVSCECWRRLFFWKMLFGI